MALIALDRDSDALENRKLPKEAGNLKGSAKTQFHTLMHRQQRGVALPQTDLTFVDCQAARKQPYERGLAGAIRANDRVNFSFFQTKINIGDRMNTAKTSADSRASSSTLMGVNGFATVSTSPASRPGRIWPQ